MQTLNVKWQRLVVDGNTCPRCHGTEGKIQRAIEMLKKALYHLGITVDFQEIEMGIGEFSKNPLMSNQILINNKSLEEWLGAKVGQSQCCEPCGDNECRTVEMEGVSYEIIPAILIIKAGLIATAEMLTIPHKDNNILKRRAKDGD